MGLKVDEDGDLAGRCWRRSAWRSAGLASTYPRLCTGASTILLLRPLSQGSDKGRNLLSSSEDCLSMLEWSIRMQLVT